MTDRNDIEKVRKTLRRGDFAGLAGLCADLHPENLAEAFGTLEDGDLWRALHALDGDQAADIFCRLEDSRQMALARDFPGPEVVDRLSRLDADDRTDLMQRLDEETRDRLLGLMSAEDRAEFEALSAFPEHSVGSVMSTEVAAVPRHLNAGAALNLIRLELPRREAIYQVFVLDTRSRLVGVVALKDLMLADPKHPIAELMRPEVFTIRATEDREKAVEIVREYDLTVLPVVDGKGVLLGMVTVDDVLDVQEEEATEDFHKLSSIRAVHSGLRDLRFSRLFLARLPWLLVLILVNLVSGAGIAFYETTIERTISLVFFLPLLIASAGNAGAQAATLMVRALATGDVHLRDGFRMLFREAGIAGMLGLTMGVAVWGLGWWRGGIAVAGVVSLTMVCVVMVGSLLGLGLPFLLTRLRLDPAAASVPLVTSLADIGGVLIYFRIATWWLGS
ncbi:MAG: magnesium transporter [Kiritimatiellia bacterium]|nr:magnesium transporter [Kiritimatiellia bacterium]